MKFSTGFIKVFMVFLAAVLYCGCMSPKINYNAEAPALNTTAGPVKEKTSVFYGTYRDELVFRVLAVAEDDGYRIVIMSDLGIKLQDMKIKEQGDTDVYFYIAYMPKETVEDFAVFFKSYYFGSEKENIKKLETRTYFFNENESVLWIKQL